MNRKKSAGLILTALSVIAAVIALVYYNINAGTNYFKSLGISPAVEICLILAIACEAVFLIAGLKKQPVWADILPVITGICLVVAMLNFISARVNGMAAIITFQNNAANMADMQSAIVGIAACAVALIITIIASFFDVTVEA